MIMTVMTMPPEDCHWINTLPDLITDNNVKICLKSVVYDNQLTINGNKFTLIGKAGNNCADDSGTILSGVVTINGNNATFKNIKFESNVRENGDNSKFINCCLKEN